MVKLRVDSYDIHLENGNHICHREIVKHSKIHRSTMFSATHTNAIITNINEWDEFWGQANNTLVCSHDPGFNCYQGKKPRRAPGTLCRTPQHSPFILSFFPPSYVGESAENWLKCRFREINLLNFRVF